MQYDTNGLKYIFLEENISAPHHALHDCGAVPSTSSGVGGKESEEGGIGAR